MDYPTGRHASFVAAMNDALETHRKPSDPDRPLGCRDEASKRLIVETRASIPVGRGRPHWRDHQFERNGDCLDTAEPELVVLTIQSMIRRIPGKQTLQRKVDTGKRHRNKHNAKADWQFAAEDAKVELESLFPQLERLAPLGYFSNYARLPRRRTDSGIVRKPLERRADAVPSAGSVGRPIYVPCRLFPEQAAPHVRPVGCSYFFNKIPSSPQHEAAHFFTSCKRAGSRER